MSLGPALGVVPSQTAFVLGAFGHGLSSCRAHSFDLAQVSATIYTRVCLRGKLALSKLEMAVNPASSA